MGNYNKADSQDHLVETTLTPGWSNRQFLKARREIEEWPEWMRAGLPIAVPAQAKPSSTVKLRL